MIDIRSVDFTYNGRDKAALRNFSLQIQKGECVLLCGGSGCGKTSVTRLVNGLIPHYYEGSLTGRVYVNGQNNIDTPVEKISGYVGSVFQNPRSQFFCVDTTSEIAFGCENRGMDVDLIMSRVDEVSRAMNIQDLLGRNIFNLSGGEKQKIACAGIAAGMPDVIVMDEPTSNLDLYAIEELAEIVRSWKKAGRTLVIAEHRLSWLRNICDRVVYMEQGQVTGDYSSAEFFDMPDSVLNDMGLRTGRGDIDAGYMACHKGFHYIGDERDISDMSEMMEISGLSYSYGKRDAFALSHVEIPVGSIVAVAGRNGAGKSTFARCISGLMKGYKGSVSIDGRKCSRRDLRKLSYMVMQDVNHQLFADDVEDEVTIGMAGDNKALVDDVLKRLDIGELREVHPMSLSGGQKQRVAIASAILADKKLIVFDEPTSGLDHCGMQQTARLLKSVKNGRILFVITHDMELIDHCCDYILKF